MNVCAYEAVTSLQKILSQEIDFHQDIQENCFLECRARLLLKECGCLPYYYPRLDAILQFQQGFENLTAACTLDVSKVYQNQTLERANPEFLLLIKKFNGSKNKIYVNCFGINKSLTNQSSLKIKENPRETERNSH